MYLPLIHSVTVV